MRPLEGHTTKKNENNLPIGIRTADSSYTIRACDPPTTATGTFTASFTVLSVTTAGGNTIITVNETATLTGSFAGIRIAQLGTLVITGHSTGVGGTGAGGFVVNDGTGALEDIHGYGPFQFTATGPTSTTGTYSVTIHT